MYTKFFMLTRVNKKTLNKNIYSLFVFKCTNPPNFRIFMIFVHVNIVCTLFTIYFYLIIITINHFVTKILRFTRYLLTPSAKRLL